jgi:hypothetical protein
VGVHVIVGRKLRLDVGQRDETSEPQQQPFGDLRDVEFAIDHREVVAVVEVMAEELVAREAIGGRVAVILAVDRRQPEAPVDVVGLHGVGHALEVNDGLVELERIRRIIIRGRPVAARPHRIGADVAAAVDPAVDLQVVGVQRLAEVGVGERHHQRAVGR